MSEHLVTGWRCRVCGTEVALTDPTPWRCPRSSPTDRRHVLRAVDDDTADGHAGPVGSRGHVDASTSTNPFVAFDGRLAWAASAAARGMSTAQRLDLVVGLDDAVREVAGTGFEVTPFERCDALCDELGFSADGGVWVKDETGGVAGSQKARHLFTISLHLAATRILDPSTPRPRLAIASCGNAALAAATLARADGSPIDVYVPTWMSDAFGDRLDELGATIHRCERRSDDPPGDPAMLRFRDAVTDGAVPFTVQGPENGLCLDGGRTIGWEMAGAGSGAQGGGRPAIDRALVQVGGGAFATCVGDGLAGAGSGASLVAVQTAGCAPFDRARRRADGMEDPASRWAELMTPWDDPRSVADGILDDETYDWLGVLDAVRASGGTSVVASEASVVRAHELARAAGFDVSPTGSAGLAGLVELGGAGRGREISPDERIAVVMSGIAR
ncbi:PLP-dependent lyase/thiolase [Ilumatobacter sp.]|uniref:PLP-dependent lyase/thiolase n=1 Tax=Ilumatobacter sp. TaxID=1967498 RepID=UPI003B529E58